MPQAHIEEIAKLLNEAGEVHHVYFGDVDGIDDDWASFYSEWLLTRSKFPSLVGRPPVRSHLTRDLVILDDQYTNQHPDEPWPTWYAKKLLEQYS